MKARVRVFFTKKRYFQKYQTKKRLLIIFLLIVNAHIIAGLVGDIQGTYRVDVTVREDTVGDTEQQARINQPTNPIGSLVEAGELENGHAGPTQEVEEGATPLSIIKKTAEKHGIDWKIVQAICQKESQCDSSKTGDSGKSWGAYQIYSVAHPEITESQARDFEWATEWTVKRLKAHAHLGEYNMIRSHNGLVTWNDYYVDDVYSIMKTL